jgi:dephospho-CoA kinase
MLRVALTGGIATGKSHVLAGLRDRGVPTIDADDIVHEELGPGTPTTKAIAREFGESYLRPDGSVNRVLLGIRVFRDPERRKVLEAFLHPVVYRRIREWFQELETTMAVACIPLLIETGHQRDFDFVVATICPPEQQLQRIIDRDGLTEAEARARIAAQMPADEKAGQADFVILTGGTRLATDRQIDELLTVLEADERR